MFVKLSPPTSSAVMMMVLIAGCDVLPSSPKLSGAGARAGSADVSSGQKFRTIDEEFSYLATVVPGGFGGMYYEQGRLVVVLQDVAQQAAAAAAISRYMLDRYPRMQQRTRRLGEMKFVQGQHDFTTLVTWKQRVSALSRKLPDLVSLDADEYRNRVVVGVANATAIPVAENILRELGLPVKALIVERRARPRPMSGTLRDRANAISGGYLLQWKWGGCTLGFNAYAPAGGYMAPVFVTASHCSVRRGRPDFNATPYWQWRIDDPNHYIGYEWFDPEPFTSDITGECPPNTECRWADAMLGAYETSRFDFGKIARTTGYGSRVIDAAQPTFGILEAVPYLYGGEHVVKIGAMTGWTEGHVSLFNNCFTSWPDSGFAFLCQTEVLFNPSDVDAGDSGSAVFMHSDYPGWVYLTGILWGSAGMSEMGNVELDLGFLNTVECSIDHPYYPDCPM